MFNDDVLAKCPECGSSETAVTQDMITCNTCGFEERFGLNDDEAKDMQKDVAKALAMARAREVLQRWGFAG